MCACVLATNVGSLSCAETAEPIETPFRGVDSWRPRNRVQYNITSEFNACVVFNVLF